MVKSARDRFTITQKRTFSKIKGQVAGLLLEAASVPKNERPRLTQRNIASMLSTGWETVHLALNSLHREGVIKIVDNRIIVNQVLLQKRA